MNKHDAATFSEKDFFAGLQSSPSGLRSAEAVTRLRTMGPNEFVKSKHGAWFVFARQFKSSLVFLLIVAALIAFWLGDYSNGVIMAVILIINAGLGFYQEYKSERIVEKLSKLVSKQVLVKRDGQTILVDESLIVPGDAVAIREGDVLVADMRLSNTDNLQMNESSLTGESVPVAKKEFSGQESLVFAGSVVEKGEGLGIVYATGGATELGSIATLSTRTTRETQYEKSLRLLSSFLMRFVMIGLAMVFVLKLAISGGDTNIVSLLLFIVAMAVAIVPEALPVIATVSLSRGALRLAKKHVVVKHLSSVEDLGNVTLLCTDKTGTITENKMTITKVVSEREEFMLQLAYASAEPVHGTHQKYTNAYDAAFVAFIPESIKDQGKKLALVKEVPFDPGARRSRTILFDEANHKYYLVVLGSAETLLDIAHTAKQKEYKETIAREGAQGLRHFGIAYKEVEYAAQFNAVTEEVNLVFLGYAVITDPLRPTAKRAIEDAERLGIQIKILTGDSKEVAEYAGKEVGLISATQVVYTGDVLEQMSSTQFAAALRANNVFARVSPTQKYNIIEELKKTDTVAYQGDGINDAPSLKLADVSIAVNSATDIAKDNADIILLRKNLEVVVDGIRYGRAIFVNINKYIKHTMISNFGNFIALSALYLFSKTLPLLPIQVLLVSVLTDIPLITISADTVGDAEIVRPEKHNMKELVDISLILGIPTAVFELFYFAMVRFASQDAARTSLFVFLAVIGLVVFYAVRNKRHFWNAKMPSPIVNIAFVFALLFSIGIIYIHPFQAAFSFVSLSIISMSVILALSLLYFLVVDFVKVRYYRARAYSTARITNNEKGV